MYRIALSHQEARQITPRYRDTAQNVAEAIEAARSYLPGVDLNEATPRCLEPAPTPIGRGSGPRPAPRTPAGASTARAPRGRRR